MIAGSVGANGRLAIRIQVSDGSLPYREIETAVATEAAVDLALPPRLIAELGLSLIEDTRLALGGVEYTTQSYIGYMEWHHGLTPVIVVATLGEPLIGRGLLLGSFLRADFMAGGEVALYSIR